MLWFRCVAGSRVVISVSFQLSAGQGGKEPQLCLANEDYVQRAYLAVR
jgi:hypothetical protein